ncbi:DUF4352 domain-containing protein [Streptomyces sp. NPDC020742]|uniref:DUF4352 domain-containing protein n=1 Tax=Streptomyces sp. NPDC020742 TaxID=3154897 RepID=UPI0033D6C550
MRPPIRFATLAIGALITAALTTGCSPSSKASEKASAEKTQDAAAAAPSKRDATTPLAIGETGTYSAVDRASGARTKMSITFKNVKTVSPSEIKTTHKPKGQYIVLTLTVKNVGDKDGGFHPRGLMKWQDTQTAEQSASTRETTGTGHNVDATYRPGQSVTGDVVLDVPRTGGKVIFYDSAGTASLTFELPAD